MRTTAAVFSAMAPHPLVFGQVVGRPTGGHQPRSYHGRGGWYHLEYTESETASGPVLATEGVSPPAVAPRVYLQKGWPTASPGYSHGVGSGNAGTLSARARTGGGNAGGPECVWLSAQAFDG